VAACDRWHDRRGRHAEGSRRHAQGGADRRLPCVDPHAAGSGGMRAVAITFGGAPGRPLALRAAARCRSVWRCATGASRGPTRRADRANPHPHFREIAGRGARR
jgi:hypothetical protein